MHARRDYLYYEESHAYIALIDQELICLMHFTIL